MTGRAVVSWSSGKDSALALHYASRLGLEIAGLLTTINVRDKSLPFHGVPEALVEAQSEAAGLPLFKVYLPPNPSNREYESAFREALRPLKRAGIDSIVFGDIFLRDVREYKERILKGTGVKPLFPLWEVDTRILSRATSLYNVKAVIASVDSSQADPSMLCKEYSPELVEEHSPGADPCGERGEFHTFVFSAPFFWKPLRVERGLVLKEGDYYYCMLRLRGLP